MEPRNLREAIENVRDGLETMNRLNPSRKQCDLCGGVGSIPVGEFEYFEIVPCACARDTARINRELDETPDYSGPTPGDR